MSTLTYVYADSTAVLGPLANQAEPHSYDLCLGHAHGLTVPRGWDVVRLHSADSPCEATGEREPQGVTLFEAALVTTRPVSAQEVAAQAGQRARGQANTRQPETQGIVARDEHGFAYSNTLDTLLQAAQK